MPIRSFVLHVPHDASTQWFQGLLVPLTDLGADLDPIGLWYPVEREGLPAEQQTSIANVFAAFGDFDSTTNGNFSPYKSVVVRYAKVGLDVAIGLNETVGYITISRRAVGSGWIRTQVNIGGQDITLTMDTEAGVLSLGSADIILASSKRCSFFVTPVNITRTITGLTQDLTLPPGAKEISYYGGLGVQAITVSAMGYEEIQANVDVEAPSYSFNLAPLGETTRVVHLTADRDNATVEISGLTLELPAYVSIPTGDIELTAMVGDQVITDLIPADATFWRFDFGGGLPSGDSGDIPAPTDPANMTVRVVSLVDGTVTYDNDGFLNDPDPVELRNGFADIEIPPPAIGCTGGVISITVPSYGDFQDRIRFVAGGTALVHLGPMRVTVQADGPFEVYFDEFSAFTWLPGDGVAKGVGSADRDVSFLTEVGGYVNVIPQGTFPLPKVIRTPVDFTPARECLLDLELGLAPGDTPGPGRPFVLEGALPGAVAGAITGAVTGILTSNFKIGRAHV